VKVAINPLQWFTLQANGVDMVREVSQTEMFPQIREAGFRAVLAEPDLDQSIDSYRRSLAASSLEAAPGYFSAPLAEADQLDSILTKARQFAWQHLQLGLREACLADDIHPDRLSAPPSTHDPVSTAVIDQMVQTIDAIAAIWQEFDLTPCVHNHVGSYIETEIEVDSVLSRTNARRVAFCPDTGHFAWAGVDSQSILDRHRDRVRLMHIKDVRAAVIDRGTRAGWDYGLFVRAGLWAEPGSGDMDLDGVLRAVGRLNGWLIVEVDHSTVEPIESTRKCAEWAERLSAELQGHV
jgi:inosose dehydratase